MHVWGSGIDWWSLTFGFDVNICDNIIYISGGELHLHLSLSSPPSLLWRLKYAKVIWTESDTLQWQKKENDTAICWWYGDEQGRRWKCERRKTDSNAFWMHKYALRPGYNCLSDSPCMRLVFRQTKGFALKGDCWGFWVQKNKPCLSA